MKCRINKTFNDGLPWDRLSPRTAPTVAKGALLLNLRTSRFHRPLSLRTARTLGRLPKLSILIQLIVTPLTRRFFRIRGLTSKLRIDSHRLPDLRRTLMRTYRVLSLRIPRLCIQRGPIPGTCAFTVHNRQPFVIVRATLLRLLAPTRARTIVTRRLNRLGYSRNICLALTGLVALTTDRLPFNRTLSRGLRGHLVR